MKLISSSTPVPMHRSFRGRSPAPHIIAIMLFGLAGIARASTIAFVGTDPSDNSWRTSSVVKPLDPDSDNVYGTAGYDVFDSSIGILQDDPAGVVVTRLAPFIYPGNGGFTQIDNPTGSGTITSGDAYYNPVTTGQILDFASLQFTLAENYVLGIYIDNADFAAIAPTALRVYQTGSGDSGYIGNTLSQTGDWFFFDVSANAGDTVNIQGVASGAFPSSGIGVITFDTGLDPLSGAPEPATTGMTLIGLVAGYLGMRRKRTIQGTAATSGTTPELR